MVAIRSVRKRLHMHAAMITDEWFLAGNEGHGGRGRLSRDDGVSE